MRVQVLASVMNQKAPEICQQMNIQSDAIIINQCDCNSEEHIDYEGHQILLFQSTDRGIGVSRNMAIDKADEDICLFSDEDIVYQPDYAAKIIAEFEQNPQADMILFNVEVEADRRTYYNEDRHRVSWYNCGRYGAVSFAIKRSRLLETGVRFSLLFGGGAPYSNGEDSLFLKHLLDHGTRIYTSPVVIGQEMPGESTWFTGYNEKFYYDRGVLYHFLYGKLALLMALRFLLMRQRQYFDSQITLKQALLWMKSGIREGVKIKERS